MAVMLSSLSNMKLLKPVGPFSIVQYKVKGLCLCVFTSYINQTNDAVQRRGVAFTQEPALLRPFPRRVMTVASLLAALPEPGGKYKWHFAASVHALSSGG